MFGLGEGKKRRGVVDDDTLVQAVRKRLLREIGSQHEAHSISNVINNHGGGGGLMEAMNSGSGGENPDLMNYLIDIEKKDDINPETGKAMGWKKTVRRHVEPRGK